MYLHLGQDTVVNTKDIIGVFDLDTTTVSKRTREFLAQAEKQGQVINVSTELPKSFVVATRKQNQTVYISQLAAPTLRGRAKNRLVIDKGD